MKSFNQTNSTNKRSRRSTLDQSIYSALENEFYRKTRNRTNKKKLKINNASTEINNSNNKTNDMSSENNNFSNNTIEKINNSFEENLKRNNIVYYPNNKDLLSNLFSIKSSYPQNKINKFIM